MIIGNDIVDLSFERILPKSNRLNFIKKICSVREYEYVVESKDPELTLWRFWSAKEASYKVLSKISDKIAFDPKQFRLDLSKANAPSHIRYGNLECDIQWFEGEDSIHCIAISHVDSHRVASHFYSEIDQFRHNSTFFDNEELASITSPQGRFVRILAKSHLQKLGIPHPRIVRDTKGLYFSYPKVYSGNKLVDQFDISLSHHGKFVAVALVHP